MICATLIKRCGQPLSIFTWHFSVW